MLQRILDDGLYTLKRSGAGKQRDDMLQETSDVWKKSFRYFRWNVEQRNTDLKKLACSSFVT